MVTEKTVAIVGAGAAGLVAAKVLMQDGFDVTLFAREKHLGGIWSPDRAYADLQTQSVAGFLEYSDLPDIEAQDFAPWQSVYKYLQKYAEKFCITERIKFGTNVVLIDKVDLKDPNLPWMVKIETANGDHQTLEFDFVVIASGLFSTPYMPVFPGQNKFAGPILHTTDIKTYDQLSNKRVVIIGGGKGAADMATLAALHGQSCHMIFRRSHWLIPPDLLHGYLPVEIAFSRVFMATFDPYPDAPHSALYHFLYRKLSFITKTVFDNASADVIATYGPDLFADKIFLPKGSLRNSENFIRITEKFLQLNREGRIIRKLASIDEILDKTTIRLDSGEILHADMIICATGFIERFPFLSETLGQILGQTTTTEGVDLELYRRLIPIGVPNIAFVGLSAAVNLWLLFEVQSHWVSDYFLGRLKLLDTEKEMHEEIRRIQQFTQKQFNRMSYYIQYYWLEPVEIYLQDMGLSLHRTNNWISEYFGIYRPERIKTLHEERQAKAQGKPIKHWYFSFAHTVLLFFVTILLLYFLFSYSN